MALKGDLASVGLADVFQMLAHNQKVGILSIHGREAWRALYFDRRGVTLYYSEQRFLDRLLDTLVRHGYVALETLDALRRQHAGDPIATVEGLLSGGLIQEEMFLDVFRAQMEEEIYDLFLWENVHWEFREGESALAGQAGVVNENFFFSADTLIMEAARRLDEWAFIREQVPGSWEIFEIVPGYASHEVGGLDDLTLPVLDLVDGKRNVARLVEVTQMTAFQVHKALSILAHKGVVQPLPAERLVPNANECIAEARLDDGIRLLERAVQLGEGMPDVHLLAAKTHEMQFEMARAAWHYKCYAAKKMENGDIESAVDTFEHTVEIVPTDLEARERLVHALMAQATPKLDPHLVGRELIDLYLELDETDRARRVLEDLLRSRPSDVELKKTLVAVHTKAGDNRRVMELYESIADDLVAQKDPIGAVRYLQKILMIDRNRREVSDRIKQLYVMDEKHRSRRRSLALVLAGLFCFGTLGTIYFFYERNVRNVYETLDPEPFLKENDFKGAVRMYEDFLRRYPLSFVKVDVEREIDRIHGLEQLAEAEKEAARRRLAAEARRKRQRYEELWKSYEQTLLERKLDVASAATLLEQVIQLAREAGEDRDQRFLADKKVEETLRTTKEYLTVAARLEKSCEEAWGKRDAERARRFAVQLHREYPYTPSASRCLVPVEIVTDPAGARVLVDGREWKGEGGAAATTPLAIRLPWAEPRQIKVSRAGFDDLSLRLKGSDDSPVNLILRVRPEAVLKLETDPGTGIGVGADVGLVGLRGGKLAGIDLATGRQRFRKSLPGLDEVHSVPLVLDSLGVFASTQGRLYAIRLRDGEQIWSGRSDATFRTALVAVPGGFVCVDAGGDLVYRDVLTGEEGWRYATGGDPVGDPVYDGERVLLTTRAGALIAVRPDDFEQSAVRSEPGPEAVSGPVRVGPAIAYLGSDGVVHGFEVRTKASSVWRIPATDPGRTGFLLPDGKGVIFVDPRGIVRRLDPATGKADLERDFRRQVLTQPLRNGHALFFVTRSGKDQTHVLSLDARDFATRWDYPVAGGVRGQPTMRGEELFVVGSDNRVHVLK